MKNIFIFDECISSKFNGVGSYLSAISSCVKESNMLLHLVSFNEDVEDFLIDNGKDCTIYKFPSYGGVFVENALPALSILKLYVDDSFDNIFLSIYSPSHIFLRTLKSLFPKSKRVSVIHDQGWTLPLLGNSSLYQRILTHRKVIETDNATQKYVKAYYKKELIMYRLSHHIVCLSSNTYELLQKIYNVPAEKLSLIPNGLDITPYAKDAIDRNLIRSNLGIREDEIVLLYSGRVVEAKGVYQLLDAFERIWQIDHRLHLVIAGITASIEDFTKHVPISISHVTFTGLISKERIIKWYQAADIGILPSFTEQCSYTGLEMMASKLLVITTDANGLRDMFDNSYAFIVKANKNTMAEELACKIMEALEVSLEERTRITEAAYQRVKDIYSLERMKVAYSQVLQLL